jgi:hypothetical protein
VAKGTARNKSTNKYEKKGTKIENDTKKNKQTNTQTNKQTQAANSIKQDPSQKAASSLASRKFPFILLKPKVYHLFTTARQLSLSTAK